MSEKLVPFDFEAFKADPSRLRHRLGSVSPLWAEAVHEFVVAQWSNTMMPTTYAANQHDQLRLVAKPPRKVKVRLYHSGYGKIKAISEQEDQSLERAMPGQQPFPWASDIVEIEVTEDV